MDVGEAIARYRSANRSTGVAWQSTDTPGVPTLQLIKRLIYAHKKATDIIAAIGNGLSGSYITESKAAGKLWVALPADAARPDVVGVTYVTLPDCIQDLHDLTPGGGAMAGLSSRLVMCGDDETTVLGSY